MKASYEDIKKRIVDPILWYDENGVPRYAKFYPDLSSNIYAKEIILLEIACQHCHKKFLVEMTFSNFDRIFIKDKKSLSERLDLFIKEKNCLMSPVHYGDPLAHNCVGDTENCIDLRVVEFWLDELKYKRVTKYEIELEKEI